MKLYDYGGFVRDYESYIKMFKLKYFKTEFININLRRFSNEVLITATLL